MWDERVAQSLPWEDYWVPICMTVLHQRPPKDLC